MTRCRVASRELRRCAARAADNTGLESAREAWHESLQLFRTLGDGWGRAQPLKDIGLIASRSGDHATATAALEESLALLREIGDKWHVADALMRLGELALFASDVEGAASRFREALSIARDLGNKTVVVEALIRYAEVCEVEGDYELARRMLDEALAIARDLSHQRLIAAVSHNLAYVALHSGDLQLAENMLAQSTEIHRALRRDLEVALDLAAFGALEVARGHHAEATRLFGASQALGGNDDFMLRREDRLEFVVGQAERIAALQATLGDDAFRRAWSEGRSLSPDDALALADLRAASTDADGEGAAP
jgi:tetratricopeptide (TPR) repeat protein